MTCGSGSSCTVRPDNWHLWVESNHLRTGLESVSLPRAFNSRTDRLAEDVGIDEPTIAGSKSAVLLLNDTIIVLLSSCCKHFPIVGAPCCRAWLPKCFRFMLSHKVFADSPEVGSLFEHAVIPGLELASTVVVPELVQRIHPLFII